MAYKQKYTKSTFPFKSPLKKEHKLSKKIIKKYKEKGISKKELEALNTTPSDTVLSVRNHPDLGGSSERLAREARFSGIPAEEQGTRVYKGNKGYTRYSKFKKR